MPLSVPQKQALKAKAHHLNPVIMIGQNGLTEAVFKEIEQALVAHELIKIKVLGGDKEVLNAFGEEICEKTGAELVQIIGRILVVYRPKPNS